LLTGGIEEFHSVYPTYIEGNNIPKPKPFGILELNLREVTDYYKEGSPASGCFWEFQSEPKEDNNIKFPEYKA